MNTEKWIEEHGDYLFRYASMRLRNRSLAEDMVQETFLAALKSMHRFDPKQSERAWLIGILRHKVIDHIRKAVREVQMENSEVVDLQDNLLFKYSGIPTMNPPRWKFSPRKAMERKEFWDVFGACLSKLEGKMHAAFVMKELEEQETEEVCKEMNITPNHLWVLIHRARANLKVCLEKNWDRSG